MNRRMKGIAFLVLVIILGFSYLCVNKEAFTVTVKDTDADKRYNDYQFKGADKQKAPEKAYATAPINDVDDYEVQVVDNLTGWRKMNDRTAKALTRREPISPDWVDMPSDSDKFQLKRKDFIDGVYKQPQPDESVFKMLEGKDVMPPNQDQLDAAEAKLIATYAPKHSAGLTKYSVQDAKEFINDFYDRQGKVPEIVEDPKYPNVYQVVGVQDKNPKIIWEPEAAPSSNEPLEYLGEETIRVPQTVVEKADPFFFSSGQGYKSWTPGLERMFAPTYAKSSWY